MLVLSSTIEPAHPLNRHPATSISQSFETQRVSYSTYTYLDTIRSHWWSFMKKFALLKGVFSLSGWSPFFWMPQRSVKHLLGRLMASNTSYHFRWRHWHPEWLAWCDILWLPIEGCADSRCKMLLFVMLASGTSFISPWIFVFPDTLPVISGRSSNPSQWVIFILHAGPCQWLPQVYWRISTASAWSACRRNS